MIELFSQAMRDVPKMRRPFTHHEPPFLEDLTRNTNIVFYFDERLRSAMI
jgi:hypothetical protein